MEASAKRKESRTFNIGVFGLESTQQKMLNRVLDITRCRNRIYRVVDAYQYPPDQIDIILVNVSDGMAVQEWKSYAQSTPAAMRRPIVKLSRVSSIQKNETGYRASLPFNPSRLLKTLDQYTIQELNYIPEFVIGDERQLPTDSLAATHLNSVNEASASPAGGKRALVVDDSLAVRRQLGIELKLRHSDITFAESGERALELIDASIFDVIFLDIVMPGIDGYAVCKKSKRSKLNKSTPVIMLTSKSSPFDKVKGTLAGCNAYLTKPINHSDFNHITEQYLVSGNREKKNDSQ